MTGKNYELPAYLGTIQTEGLKLMELQTSVDQHLQVTTPTCYRGVGTIDRLFYS